MRPVRRGDETEAGDDADAEERYARVCAQLAGDPRVSVPDARGERGFGSSALKARGSIFAMLSHGRFVVKLPRERVAALVSGGKGAPFTAGKATPLKEWVTVESDEESTWLRLAREALQFVAPDSTAT